ncbi:hypothetical protein BJY52DRAFT_295696 [Lactarius psammicola]|nr:hypothetical protein BJY52DRAFT_295696 [Lactarius psammicola]
MVDETQPMTNAQPMEWAPVSSSVEWTTGNTRPKIPEVSAPLPARPLSEELGFSGDLSDLTPQGDDPSELMDDGSSSSSDVPLFSLVYPLRGARKRALPAEEPLHSKKGKGKGKSKGKGKAKTRASESKDGSSYVEDSEKGASTDTDVDIFVPRPTSAIPATAQYSSSKDKNAKVKTPARISHIEGNTRNTSTSPRKRFRAQSHHTSDEDISDTDVVPQARPARNNRLRTKSPWRVVEPPKSRACPTQRLAAPSSRPRVWAGVRQQRRAVGCAPCACEKQGRHCMGKSRIPYAHILWGERRRWAGLVGQRCLGEPQDRLLGHSRDRSSSR